MSVMESLKAIWKEFISFIETLFGRREIINAMDYTELYHVARMTALAQGVSSDQYYSAETWYYDETDNVKHLVLLPTKNVNAIETTCFVLGGVQADVSITDTELRNALGKAPGRELKSTKDLKGTFVDILRKENFSRMLTLIENKGWNIHFFAVQVWYYAFVDIIDSINDDMQMAFAMKALLYKILKATPADTANLLGMYHYPDIKDKDKTAFLDGIITLISQYMSTCSNAHDQMMAIPLTNCLEEAKKKKELTFIQDETPDKWVEEFVNFYRTEIASCPNKTLVLDTEKQVEKALIETPIKVEGKVLKNYRFDDSDSSPMIQICDYVVSILRKYFIFTDRTLSAIDKDVASFDETQLNNFKLLNRLLKKSLDSNPLYFHYITSVELQCNLNQLMIKYA